MQHHLKPRSTTIALYQGDDMDRLADLRRAVDIAKRIVDQKATTARVGDDDQSVAAAEAAFDAFVDEAAERALTVELHSIGRRRFRDLVTAHPPRKVDSEPDDKGETRKVDHEDDAGYGVNYETFSRALLAYREGSGDDFLATVAEPGFASGADLERFIDDELADGDYEQLFIAAFMLNRSPSRDPKGIRYGLASQSSAET